MLRTFLCVGAAALLAGCSTDYSPNNYDSTAVQRAAKVDQGIVVGRRVVDVTPSGTTGAVAGAAAGGIAGSQVGNGVTQAFGALGGGLLGGALGEAAEKTTGQTHAYEYIVREGSNTLVSVTQQDKTPLAIGQKVLVIAGNQARIVPDYTVAVDPAPPASGTEAAAKPPPVAAAPLAPPGGAASGASAPDAAVSAATGAAPAAAAKSGDQPTIPVPAITPASTEKTGSEPSPLSLVPPPAKLTPDQ